MNGFNKVILIGNLTRNPELRYTPSGTPVASFALAVKRRFQQGEELKEARFYARLYVALYYESEGDEKKCREYLTEAVEKYKIGHYMWDVAAVHLKLLKEKK